MRREIETKIRPEKKKKKSRLCVVAGHTFPLQGYRGPLDDEDDALLSLDPWAVGLVIDAHSFLKHHHHMPV